MKKLFILLLLIVVYTAQSQSLRLIYPNGGENIIAGEELLLQWETDNPNNLVEIEYSLDNGVDWRYIDTSRGNSYLWKNRSFDTTSDCIIKVTQFTNDFESKHIQFLKTILSVDAPIYSVKFSTDDKLIIFSYANVIEVRNLEKDSILYKLVLTGLQFDFDVSKDNRFLAYGNNGKVEIMNLETGLVEKSLITNKVQFSTVKFSNDGNTIVYGDYDGSIIVWDINTSSVLHRIQSNNQRIIKIKFDQNDERFVTSSHDSTVKIWDVDNGSLIYTFDKHKNSVWSLEFADNGKNIVSVSQDSTVLIWNIDDKEIVKSIKNDAWIWSITYDSTSKLVYYGNSHGTLHCVSIHSNIPNFSLKAHNDVLRSLDVNSQSNLLATVSWDNTVKLWKINSLHTGFDQSDSSFSFLKEITSINNSKENNEILTVVQKENSNSIEINLHLLDNGISTLKVLNSIGIMIESKEISSIGLQKLNINIDNYSSGTYHIVVTTPTRTETASFIVVK